MNIRAVITTTEIKEQKVLFYKSFTCELHINGEWSGDLRRDTKQELESLCLAICAISELTKANQAYQHLKSMKHSLNSDFDTKSKEVERFNQEAHNKLNGE